jgi:hypothetical protein
MTHITRIVTPTRYVARRGELAEFFATHRIGDFSEVSVRHLAPFHGAPYMEVLVLG